MALDRTEIAAQLRRDIDEGKYSTGAKLPPYRQLARDMGAAPNTVGEAIRLLASDGVVTVRRNARAVVNDPAAVPPADRQIREELTEVRDELHELKGRIAALDSKVTGVLGRMDT